MAFTLALVRLGVRRPGTLARATLAQRLQAALDLQSAGDQHAKARFPVIDLHSHDYAMTDEQIAEWVRTMDELGIKESVISMTGTCSPIPGR